MINEDNPDVNPIVELRKRLAGLAQIDDDREAAREAVGAVIKFMQRLPGFTPQIYAPLVNLGLALDELIAGAVPPMLKPANKPKGGRPSVPYLRAATKGFAAAVMEVLMTRAEMSRLDAAGEVAKVLRKNHIPVGSRDSTIASQKATVAQWRFDAVADRQSPSGEIFYALAELTLSPDMDPSEVKRRALQYFDEMLKEFRLKGSPPTDF